MEDNSNIIESFWKVEKEIFETIEKIDLSKHGIQEKITMERFFGSLNISSYIYSDPVIFQADMPLIVLSGESGMMYFLSLYALFPHIKEKHAKLIKQKKEKEAQNKIDKEKKVKEQEDRINKLLW